MDNTRHKAGRENRFKVSEPTVDDPVLIVCPKCAQKAVVIPCGEDRVRASCLHCGYTNERSTDRRVFYWFSDEPGDGYFGYQLWLRTDCNGNSLWAFNVGHLTMLESFIGAKLRERSKDEKLGWSNAAFTSRLPAWIKSGKNREALLKAINELKARV